MAVVRSGHDCQLSGYYEAGHIVDPIRVYRSQKASLTVLKGRRFSMKNAVRKILYICGKEWPNTFDHSGAQDMDNVNRVRGWKPRLRGSRLRKWESGPS